MKKVKNGGITLIALVVTIVVLLILAGVSIAMLTGDNGIITQAQNSQKETEIGQEKEEIRVAYSGAVGENLGTKVTAEDMQKQFDINGTEATASGDIDIEFVKSGRTYKITNGAVDGPYDDQNTGTKTLVEMFKQAQADGCKLTHETCSNSNHLHIGDYLKYIPEENKTVSVEKAETGYDGTQTYTTDLTTTWRVLGLNDDETELQIISGSPIKKEGTDPYLWLKGAESYVYCEKTLDKISLIYKNNYATETRSIRLEDINKALGLIKEGNKLYKKDDASKNNLNMYYEKTYTYKTGDQTPESYLGIGTVKVGDTITGTRCEYSSWDLLDNSSTLWKMLFESPGNIALPNKPYWLASPRTYADTDFVYFGPGYVYMATVTTGGNFFNTYGSSYGEERAVRPLISLKSNITEKEIPIISGSEVEWTTTPSQG